MTGKEKGILGEQLAAEHYKADGYTVLQANYRTRLGEIDLVVQQGNTLVFAEVKTRSGKALAFPREWVDANKQRKLTLAAMEYLQTHQAGDPFVRFDVVEIYLCDPEDGKNATVNRIENAFEG